MDIQEQPVALRKKQQRGMNLHAEYRNYIAVYPQGVNFWVRQMECLFLSAHGMIWKAMLRQERERPICINSRGQYPRPKECKEYSHCAWTGCYDDIGFIKKVIEEVAENYSVDRLEYIYQV
ncbi:MAG: hypothetical protein CM1200mP12_04730 [Gammaproteobacteria bacterium]|nr:MAG: hypothetical protein CM1200mP12_04730 [Gammaproteobacteria bacterium]